MPEHAHTRAVRRPSPAWVTGVVVVGALLLAGCAVDVPETRVSGARRAACESLVAALPEHVSDQARRATRGNPLSAAWGDPAIVLRCGVGRPQGYDAFAQCQQADGLGWFVPARGMNDQSVDVVMTTVGRDPAVEVTLPATYRPPVAAMVDLGDVVREHTREVGTCS